jgi:hypothetical protein
MCHLDDGAFLCHKEERIETPNLEYALKEFLVLLLVLAIFWLPFEFGGYLISVAELCFPPIEHVG